MRKYRSIFIGATVGALAFAGVALATNRQVTLCHRTNNAGNPYIKMTVNVALQDTGHDSHTGPLASSLEKAKQLKATKTKWGDIIPDKLNWSTDGQAILANKCQVPVTEPTPPAPVTTGQGSGGDTTTTPATLPATGATY